MKLEMAKFLFEQATRRYGYRVPDELTLMGLAQKAPINPLAPKAKPAFMDRPMFEGHKTHPELSRPGFAPAMAAMLSHPVGAVIAIGIAVPLFSHYMAQKTGTPHHQFAPEHFNNPTQLYLQ